MGTWSSLKSTLLRFLSFFLRLVFLESALLSEFMTQDLGHHVAMYHTHNKRLVPVKVGTGNSVVTPCNSLLYSYSLLTGSRKNLNISNLQLSRRQSPRLTTWSENCHATFSNDHDKSSIHLEKAHHLGKLKGCCREGGRRQWRWRVDRDLPVIIMKISLS